MAASPKRLSAGVALYRVGPTGPELFLVHPGGPFWANKDEHGWSIPKGEVDEADSEGLEQTARREFTEETGHAVPAGNLIALPEFRIGSGKNLQAFLIDGDVDPDALTSNDFDLEWPPRSGRIQQFPEVDRAAWFDLDTARTKLHKGQVPLVDAILTALEILAE